MSIDRRSELTGEGEVGVGGEGGEHNAKKEKF